MRLALFLGLLGLFGCAGHAQPKAPPQPQAEPEEDTVEEPEPPEVRVMVRLRHCPMTTPPILPQLVWAPPNCPPGFLACLDPADSALLQRYLRDARAWADDVFGRCHSR